MASTVPKDKHLIENIEMEAFGSTKGRLATIGVGPCICFVLMLDDGCEVFLEHRSDAYLPATITTENIDLCLQNLAEHVNDVSPSSQISAVLILGGNAGSSRFDDIQKAIDTLIEAGDADNDDKDISRHYKQLLTSIKVNDVKFNIEDPLEEFERQSNFDIVIDKNVNGKERTMFVLQRFKSKQTLDYFIGVLAIELTTNKRSFAIVELEQTKYENKISEDYNFFVKAAKHFECRAKALGAIEIEGNAAFDLLNYGRDLSTQVDSKFSKNQIELTEDDQEMCECLVSGNKDRPKDHDEAPNDDDDEDDMDDM